MNWINLSLILIINLTEQLKTIKGQTELPQGKKMIEDKAAAEERKAQLRDKRMR